MSKDWEQEHEYEVKGERRQKKLNKKRNMMRVNSRGLKTLIQPIIGERAKKEKKTDFSRSRVTERFLKSYTFEY